ncbi:MAG TPA: hypothetical protein VIL92_06160 [Gaiellaceae bacterium]
MSDPLTNIEDRKAQTDLGVTSARIFAGAREEGATFWEATAIIFAWFRAALNPPLEEPPEDTA